MISSVQTIAWAPVRRLTERINEMSATTVRAMRIAVITDQAMS